MLLAGVGASVVAELGFGSSLWIDDDMALDFGPLRPLVDLMQQTPPDRLQVELIERLKRGEVDLHQLTAAAALANAESFGGEDYVGYHAEMALVPALEMSAELTDLRRALPVLKVIWRNTQQIQEVGKDHHVLHQVMNAEPTEGDVGDELREAARRRDMAMAERLFAAVEGLSPVERIHVLLPSVEDDTDVHRFVLAHRVMELVDIVGLEHAQTMLRQCVRYCVSEEESRTRSGRAQPAIRELLPKIVDQYGLANFKPGDRDPGDAEVEALADVIYRDDETRAVEAVAAALADGISPDAVAEAISLAANALILRQGTDPWRTHGASAGVHASDAANAWRHMVRLTNPYHTAVGLVCSAYHTARFETFAGEAYPIEAHRQRVKTTEPGSLLGLAEEGIRANDQALAAAAIAVYGDQGYPTRPVFDLMLKYAVSEDGRLHAEKYYRTVVEEFATMRPAFRWRQLVAIARVTASAYGLDMDDKPGGRAPGYVDACERLGIES